VAELCLVRPVRVFPTILLLISVSFGRCAPTLPLDTPVRLRQGVAVEVPFSVGVSGTYDIQLQYPKDSIAGIFKGRPFDQLTGTATLRSGNEKLDWELPTGWDRLSPYDSTAFGMVLRRFHAYANTPYVLTLRIIHVPEQLKRQGVISVYPVGPHFHPGHHVYELQ
jgi:hypothetical protein